MKTETADHTQTLSPEQHQMNVHYSATVQRLLGNAERDTRLARTRGNAQAWALAQARRQTLEAALGIYAAAHLHAHGQRPWVHLAGEQ